MLKQAARLLTSFGVTPDTARTAATVLAREAVAIGGDMLGATVEREVSNFVRPTLQRMRNELLASIAGEPPTSFALRLRARGTNISDEQVVLLWSDIIASLAEEPAKSSAA